MYKQISKVLFSRSFRRMSGKTQLFSNYSNDHYHNRLTHVLEVESISEQICKSLKICCNDLLIRNIALSHDLGHTPFGHAGERALNDIAYQLDNLGGLLNFATYRKVLFKHNYYSAKVLLGIGPYNNKIYNKILAGVILHTDLDYKKYPLSIADKKKTMMFYVEKYGQSRHVWRQVKNGFVEAYLVALADEIAQVSSDLHDILTSRMLVANKSIIDKVLPKSFRINVIGYPSDIRIKSLVNSLTNYLVDGVRYNKTKGFYLLKAQQSSFDYVKEMTEEVIQSSPLVRYFDNKGIYVIKKLFKAYYSNPSLMEDKTINKILEISNSVYNSYSFLFRTKLKTEFVKALCAKTQKEKIDFVKLIIYNCKSFSTLSKENKNFVKSVNTQIVFSIVFTIANMTDRYSLARYSDLFGAETK